MLAILFANLFAPLIDHFVVQANIKRREAVSMANDTIPRHWASPSASWPVRCLFPGGRVLKPFGPEPDPRSAEKHSGDLRSGKRPALSGRNEPFKDVTQAGGCEKRQITRSDLNPETYVQQTPPRIRHSPVLWMKTGRHLRQANVAKIYEVRGRQTQDRDPAYSWSRPVVHPVRLYRP